MIRHYVYKTSCPASDSVNCANQLTTAKSGLQRNSVVPFAAFRVGRTETFQYRRWHNWRSDTWLRDNNGVKTTGDNMACTIKANRHGYLAFRLYWDGHKFWEGTRLKDTPKNRRRMEARAVLISEEMERRTFDYLAWFPEGNNAQQFRPAPTAPQTMANIIASG